MDVLAVKRASRKLFRMGPVLRRAIEDYAMNKAKCHYAEDWDVADVSRIESYDLHCTRIGQEALRVEVKGTASDGLCILLTPNEVEQACRCYPRVALFIVANIQVGYASGAPALLSGGETIIFEPWAVEAGVLKPIGYEYEPPVHV